MGIVFKTTWVSLLIVLLITSCLSIGAQFYLYYKITNHQDEHQRIIERYFDMDEDVLQ